MSRSTSLGDEFFSLPPKYRTKKRLNQIVEEGSQGLAFTFTDEEAQYLLSMLRISADEDARVLQNVTVQRADQEIINIVAKKVAEQM